MKTTHVRQHTRKAPLKILIAGHYMQIYDANPYRAGGAWKKVRYEKNFPLTKDLYQQTKKHVAWTLKVEPEKIPTIKKDIQQGKEIPPIQITYDKGKPEIVDGNHRFYSLYQSGIRTHPAIIVTSKKATTP